MSGVEYPRSKPRPPRGWSYPLTRSALDEALEGLAEETVVGISFIPRRGPALRALFKGEAARGWHAAGRATLYIHAVPSGERREIANPLLEVGLPRLRDWLDDVERAGNARRATDHGLELAYADGALQVTAW